MAGELENLDNRVGLSYFQTVWSVKAIGLAMVWRLSDL